MPGDPIEKLLSDLKDRCLRGWEGKPPECAACPLGEIAAMLAAALTFYQENRIPHTFPGDST